MHQAGDRPLADRPSLQEDVDNKALDAERDVAEREGIGRRRDQLNASRDLGGKCADEGEKQQPENERFGHSIQVAAIKKMIAGLS